MTPHHSTSPPPHASDPRVARVITFFEHLQASDLPRMGEVYASNATFKDPFNTVEGLHAVSTIFAHMFKRVQAPKFVVNDAALQGDAAFLVWDFSCRMRTGKQEVFTIHGASHLRFDAAGLVSYHRDYWDAAEEVYEKVPVLGAFMRLLKRRAAS